MLMRLKWFYSGGEWTSRTVPSLWLWVWLCLLCVCVRVVASLQRQLVMSNFVPEFSQKLQNFYGRLYFPAELKSLKNRCGAAAVSSQSFWINHCCLVIFMKTLCVLQPLCASLGWHPVRVRVKGTECDRHQERQRQEGRSDGTGFHSWTEDRAAAETTTVRTSAHTHSVHLWFSNREPSQTGSRK